MCRSAELQGAAGAARQNPRLMFVQGNVFRLVQLKTCLLLKYLVPARFAD